ncbi:putative helix-turn-helix transcriptional regulator [Candidatus Hepatincolaceae symbiont of Richtersius coronifer]
MQEKEEIKILTQRLKEIRKNFFENSNTLMAHKLKTNERTIQRWMAGTNEPSRAYLQILAQTIGTTVDSILGKNPPENKSS